MNLEQLCPQVVAVARKAGDFIRTERTRFQPSQVEKKGLHDFVSYVDREAETIIVEALRLLTPHAGFITEEASTEQASGQEYRWVIDPLDGTTNFIHGVAPFAVSIGLMHHDEVVLGVVYEVNLDECFYAWEGSKAYCNGREIQVSGAPGIEGSLIATGFPYTDFSKMRNYMGCTEYLMEYSHGLRRLGSSATDLAYVAAGRFDAFYEYSLKVWDVAAGACILRQAGGLISDFKGGNDYLFGREIVAGSPKVFLELQEVVKKHFSNSKM